MRTSSTRTALKHFCLNPILLTREWKILPYICDVNNDTKSSDSPTIDLNDPSPELERLGSRPATPESDSRPTTSELEVSFPSTSSLDDTCIVITRIRAQHILSGFKRLPVGFYVLVQFGVNQQRTKNKSIPLNDMDIVWEDEILLSPKAFDTVRFTVYASFELEPTLGNGEALYTSERRSEELDGGTCLIKFSEVESGTSVPNPTLLITLRQWCSDHAVVPPSGITSNLVSEVPSAPVRETDLGQGALLRYYKQYRTEDIKEAVQYFEDAWRECPLTHPCRAAVLVNLAKAKFMSCQADPTGADPNESIQLYQEALNLRRPGHPDRPATVLQLAQTLLFRYEKQGCNEPVACEIEKLLTPSHDLPEDSHERRAADLILETLERCRAVNSRSLAELDQLVPRLERSAMVPPDGYFDRPQRLINLSTTLWRRYEGRGELSDLDRSLDINKQVLQLLQCRHPDRLSSLRILNVALWKLYEIRGDLSYLRELIGLKKEALQFIPDGHPERLYWISDSKSRHVETLESLGDKALEAQKYEEAIAQYNRTIIVLRSIPS
ncbi:hypothetical protein F5141DRAFT_489268 [Pisolithus sp. B1]|nr:hypothetical protein F5141DRAFT_489268 [Pisolithus sp. B1]